MKDQLEDFIRNNRDAFDDESPAPKVWADIRRRVEPETGSPAKVIAFSRRKFYAAAAVAILLTGTLFFLLGRRPAAPGQIADTGGNHLPKPVDTAASAQSHSPETKPAAEPTAPERETTGSDRMAQAAPKPERTEANERREEMFHYTRLIEIKHQELKQLEKDEPLLYRQFSGDVARLDSVYRTLKLQMNGSGNREQLLEAMIANLQLQIGLLNRQLGIIKQINHAKKTSYEKAYRSA